jgi:SAM-dependent methyltransferase
VARLVLPERVKHGLRARRHLLAWPPVGLVRFGHLRRTAPLTDDFGYARGLPIDRHYIESFLADHAPAVSGAVLEFQDDAYVRRFGREVTSIDVINFEPDYPGTTLVADLAVSDGLPVERFDCIVCTGVVQLVYDIEAAVQNLHRMLRPGGTVLVTMPGITRIAREAGWEDQWRLTSSSARKLFAGVFGPDKVDVWWYGNALTATALLMGLATRDLKQEELDAQHPEFEVVIAVRATKAGGR